MNSPLSTLSDLLNDALKDALNDATPQKANS
jgi:hypothetical protein